MLLDDVASTANLPEGKEGEEEGRGNLQEVSHGPAAAEHKLPGPVRSWGSSESAAQHPFKEKTIIKSALLFSPSPPHPPPAVGRTWAGEGAPWLGRTETPAEEGPGKNKWTTSRRSLISRKSWEREYPLKTSLYYQTQPTTLDLNASTGSIIFNTNTLGHLN